MPLGTKHAKFHDSTMIRLGCRGGGLLKGVAHLLFGSHLYRPHVESGKLGKGGGMEWMDGRNFSPVFYMISDPLGPLPPKKEKQMGNARAKRGQ